MSDQPDNKKQRFSQNKKRYYTKKKNWLEPGMRGFLATCNFRERDCVRECYNILNHYADELYGAIDNAIPLDSNDATEAGAELDIADVLQQQIDSEKQKNRKSKDLVKHRFDQADTGANNCIFIRTMLPDPVELGRHIVADIAGTKQQRSRFLLRLIPVECVCRATLADIMKTSGVLFDKHFLKESSTFSIVFNRRLNESIKREDLLAELAGLIISMNAGNRVDLKNAEKTVIVEIIKGLCLISVIKGYAQNKKYNLIELANPAKPENSVKVEVVEAARDQEDKLEKETDKPEKVNEPQKDNADI